MHGRRHRASTPLIERLAARGDRVDIEAKESWTPLDVANSAIVLLRELVQR